MYWTIDVVVARQKTSLRRKQFNKTNNRRHLQSSDIMNIVLQACNIVLKNHCQTSIKVNIEKRRQNGIASNVRRRKQQEVSTLSVNFTNPLAQSVNASVLLS
jgi:hypothetical protein